MRMNISEQMTIGLDILKTSDYNMSVLLYCQESVAIPVEGSTRKDTTVRCLA